MLLLYLKYISIFFRESASTYKYKYLIDLPLETVYRILHEIYSCKLDDLRSLIDAQFLYGQQQTSKWK